MRPITAITTVATCVILSLASYAAADPIAITGGFLSVGAFIPGRGDIGRNVTFSLSGQDGFAVSGHGFDVFTAVVAQCRQFAPCAAGTPVSAAANVGVPGAFGPASISGVNYSTVRTNGGFQVTAGTVTIPNSSADALALQTPFTLIGLLELTSVGGGRTEPLGSFSLQGQGRATVSFERAGDGFQTAELRYDFASATASPTPEPASVILLATGAVMLVRRARRREVWSCRQAKDSLSGMSPR